MTTWTGDRNDDCFLQTDDGYQAHAEAMDEDEWCCIVTHGDTWPPPFNGRMVYHSAEQGIWPIRGEAARLLCELVIDADRWKQRT